MYHQTIEDVSSFSLCIYFLRLCYAPSDRSVPLAAAGLDEKYSNCSLLERLNVADLWRALTGCRMGASSGLSGKQSPP